MTFGELVKVATRAITIDAQNKMRAARDSTGSGWTTEDDKGNPRWSRGFHYIVGRDCLAGYVANMPEPEMSDAEKMAQLKKLEAYFAKKKAAE